MAPLWIGHCGRVYHEWAAMVERICIECRFFSSAPTWVEPSAWGYCTKLLVLGQGPQPDVRDAQPVFTWSDASCDDFESGSQSVPCG